MAEPSVGTGGEDLEAPVGVLEDRRIAGDRRTELVPCRPAASPARVDLPGVAERAGRPGGKDLEATVRGLEDGGATRVGRAEVLPPGPAVATGLGEGPGIVWLALPVPVLLVLPVLPVEAGNGMSQATLSRPIVIVVDRGAGRLPVAATT